MATSTQATGSGRKLLRMLRYKKQWRGRSGTSDRDTIVELLFSLTPMEGGQPNGPGELFWCEVQLRQSLALRPGWAKLDKNDLVKALYCYAIDAIKRAGGRVTRNLPVEWVIGAPYAEGPHWDLSAVDLARPEPVVVDAADAIVPVVVHQH